METPGDFVAKTIKLTDTATRAPKRRPSPVLVAPQVTAGDAAPSAVAPPAEATPVAAVPTLKLRDLLDRVAERSGAKKKDSRAVIEATLAALGDALAAGEAINLPGLGRGRVNRQKDTVGGEVLIVKLKRPAPGAKVKKLKGHVDEDGDTGLAGDDD